MHLAVALRQNAAAMAKALGPWYRRASRGRRQQAGQVYGVPSIDASVLAA